MISSVNYRDFLDMWQMPQSYMGYAFVGLGAFSIYRNISELRDYASKRAVVNISKEVLVSTYNVDAEPAQIEQHLNSLNERLREKSKYYKMLIVSGIISMMSLLAISSKLQTHLGIATAVIQLGSGYIDQRSIQKLATKIGVNIAQTPNTWLVTNIAFSALSYFIYYKFLI